VIGEVRKHNVCEVSYLGEFLSFTNSKNTCLVNSVELWCIIYEVSMEYLWSKGEVSMNEKHTEQQTLTIFNYKP
jgi:hypothetical protein